MFNAKNGTLALDGDTIDYIAFGQGERTLIILPGLGDGLKTVKGMARPFSVSYRKLAKHFRVYVFSRRNQLPDDYTSRDMARDVAAEMDMLGIEKACVLGVSQGGTIAQQLTLDNPERVERLILTVTYSRVNETIRRIIEKWIACAENNDYATIVTETAELSYSEKYLAKMRRFYPILVRLPLGIDFRRFIIQARACLSHDSYDRLGELTVPTLIIAGREDKIVTAKAAEDMHERIKDSRLVVYDRLGHGLYEEAEDFHDRIIDFIKENELPR